LQLIKCPRRIMSIEFGVDDPIAGRKLHEWKNMAGSRAQAGAKLGVLFA